MNIRERFLITNLVIIIFFTLIYKLISNDNFNKPINFMDALYFATVTQSTVGYGDIYPTTNKAKFIVCAQIIITVYINICEIIDPQDNLFIPSSI